MAKNWLEGKRIVVIGGTAGIGLSAALAFVSEGAKVVVTGRDALHVEEASSKLRENGVALLSDAVVEGSAEAAIQRCHEQFGGFHGLYHVAGGSGRKYGDGPLHEITLEGWQKTMDINLTALMLSNRAAATYFLEKSQPGVILNMSSVLAFSPSPEYFSTHAYAAAKSAVTGFSKSIAAYYASKNIRVNVIAPALVETPMSKRAANDEIIAKFISTKQPLDGGRIGIPADTDGLAVFLLSDAAKFVTGQVVSVDGGWAVTEGQY